LKRLSIWTAIMACVVAAFASGVLSGTLLKVRRPPETQQYKNVLDARLAKWLSVPVKDMP
jgi:hypothetical protein